MKFKKANQKPSLKLAILLPERSRDPSFLWIKIDKRVKRNVTLERPDISHYITEAPKNICIPHENHIVQFWARDSYFGDGSRLNKCLTKLTNGKDQYSWRGRILVLRQSHSDDEKSPEYEDITVADIGAVIKHFSMQNSPKRKRDEELDLKCKYSDPKFNATKGAIGVMISCKPDMDVLGQARFCQVRAWRSSIHQRKRHIQYPTTTWNPIAFVKMRSRSILG